MRKTLAVALALVLVASAGGEDEAPFETETGGDVASAPEEKPAAGPTGEQVDRWIVELDADEWRTREAAEKKLAKLGPDWRPRLEEALRRAASAEQRARLRSVLDALGRSACWRFTGRERAERSPNAQDATVEAIENGRGLRWVRNGGADGGSIAVYLPLSAEASEVRLAGELRIDEQTLDGPGWWSDTHGGCYEYPIHLALVVQGRHDWCRGYLRPFDRSTRARNHEALPKEGWNAFDTGWVKPRAPTKLIALGGNGWSFDARVRNLSVRVRRPPRKAGD